MTNRHDCRDSVRRYKCREMAAYMQEVEQAAPAHPCAPARHLGFLPIAQGAVAEAGMPETTAG